MVRVLLDHNMPPRIARALDAVAGPHGHKAVALRDAFPKDISDREYFGHLISRLLPCGCCGCCCGCRFQWLCRAFSFPLRLALSIFRPERRETPLEGQGK
ncbi:MAG: hypothetical protein GDA53_05465 [Rhodobacteraceae bacterium]|nr:hypothetical protein [Paracoccaceae bacterium]